MLTVRRDDFHHFPFLRELAERVEHALPTVLLVPEGQALATERRAAACLPASAPLSFEVSNFTRLADRVFRTHGGISYRYADRVAEALLMWRVLDEYTPFLKEDGAGSATDTVKEKLSAMNELWAAGLTPEDLLRVAALSEGEVLKGKLSDLAAIMEQYEGALAEGYGSHAKDLDKLLGILKETPVFADTAFFVSGFTSFTARELLILVELARQGDVTVALPLPDEGERALCYEETLETFRTLRALCAKAGVPMRRIEGEPAPRADALRHAQKNLFRTDRKVEKFEGTDGSLSLLRAADPFSACAEIASEIAARVRAGARYRDFTVITRESAKYDGILDAAFSSLDIPFFFATETELPELSLCKMILSAYAAVLRGWRQNDVISYMKCGYTGIARDDCDRFELYLSFWRLHGRALSEDKPFDMHPRGYEGKFTEGDAAALALVNRVREALLSPLWRLAATARAQMTVREHTTALYRFLCDVHAEETLGEMARRERRAGRVRESEVLARLFSVLCGLLDTMVQILGESTMTGARFTELLSLVFSSSSLGSLPTAVDAVTVGNADMLCPDEGATVFLLGVCEGEFPAAVAASQGAFLEEERRSLLSLGVAVGKDPAVRASREQFVFLRALCTGRRAVAISYEANALGGAIRPNEAFLRLEALFGEARRAESLCEIFTPRAATEQFSELIGTPKGDAIAHLLAEDPAYTRYTEAASLPISDTACRVEEDTARKLFPDTVYTSQSRMDKYLDCPFSYYCRYVLRLPENERAAIRTLEIGTTMHAILEALFETLAREGKTIRELSHEELTAIIEDACRAHLLAMCPESQQNAPRIAHLFARLRRAAVLVAKDLQLEFSHADFTPRFCELQIGAVGAPEALVFRDENGKRVCFGGKIDRVDVYRAPTGETFVRVVDYKSSTHDFSREELRRGRNLQMFVYLCALWKSKNEEFRARLDLAPGEELLPAGVVYSKSSPALPTLCAPAPKDTLEADAMAKLERSGFFLREEDVLRAMDDTFSGHLVPVALDKQGALKYKKESAFGSLVEFGEMLDEAEDAVCAVATRMREGVADASPDESAKYPPCEGCAFRPLCRRED